MEPSKPPRVFISYSWESEGHKSWVRHLGENLYEAGIEARLDQWFVQPGESFTAFMEQEVAAADFVLVVCTPSYAHKSNNRQGGVGYEQQIVSGQLMSGTARSKFIPILRKGSYEPGSDCAIPTHFLGIAWIEFRDDEAFEISLEDLIRVIFSKPRFAPPRLGAQPSLDTITATRLNRIRLTEADGSREHPDSNIEKSDSVKSYVKETGVKLKPADAEFYYERGLSYFAKSDYDRAVADYNTAIELDPDYAAAYYDRGLAYAAKGEMDRAIADYNRVIELDPDYAEAYHNRGLAYAAKWDYDDAIANYNRAIGLNPDYAAAYYNRGVAYFYKGDRDRAIADFRKSYWLFTTPGDREKAVRELRMLGFRGARN
jgi:regulator of sirC expression with transglutaminase-like and TPR domain